MQLVSNRITHHLSFLGFYFCPFVTFIVITIICCITVISYVIIVTEPFLSIQEFYLFFPILCPIPLHGGRREHAATWYLSCWLGLNHNTLIPGHLHYLTVLASPCRHGTNHLEKVQVPATSNLLLLCRHIIACSGEQLLLVNALFLSFGKAASF